MSSKEMSERELAEFYDSHRGDTSIWQSTPMKARTPRPGGPSIVISVRFSRQEVRQLKDAAANGAMTLSEFIRRSALERASTAGVAVRTSLVEPPIQPHLSFFTVTCSGDERRSA